MAAQQQQTEKLIEEMLGFLDSTSEEEEEDDRETGPQRHSNCNNNNADDIYESTTEEEAGEPALRKTVVAEAVVAAAAPLPTPKKDKKKSKNSIAKELKKIKTQFPIWNTKEIASSSRKLTDPIWRQERVTSSSKDAPGQSATAVPPENDWSTKLESTCRRSSNAYVQEVNRAIYGDTAGHPPNGSAEYFNAAQNYAIYGNDFLDFPENLTPLLSTKLESTCRRSSNAYVQEVTSPFAASVYGNGLYPTPAAPEVNAGVGFSQFGQQSAAASSAAATAAYYQMCNGMQPRPATGSTATYGMFLGNKVTYVAAAPAPQPLVYNNQHAATTTNFISNSLANAALASSPAILYSNPMLTTTTQQYLNTFFKETQYLSGGTAQGQTTGIYERLVYAQMLQQQIYHQTQQQAAAVAAMFHKSRPTRATATGNGGVGGGAGAAGGAAPQATPISTQQQQPTPSLLNLCGRQAQTTGMNVTLPAELLAVNKSTLNSMNDVDITALLPLGD